MTNNKKSYSGKRTFVNYEQKPCIKKFFLSYPTKPINTIFLREHTQSEDKSSNYHNNRKKHEATHFKDYANTTQTKSHTLNKHTKALKHLEHKLQHLDLKQETLDIILAKVKAVCKYHQHTLYLQPQVATRLIAQHITPSLTLLLGEHNGMQLLESFINDIHLQV